MSNRNQYRIDSAIDMVERSDDSHFLCRWDVLFNGDGVRFDGRVTLLVLGTP